MKKMLLAFAIIACLLSVSNAQERISGQDVYTENEYTVQKGDTLWYLEGLQRGDSTQWRRLVELNPFLKKPGRIYYKDGMTVALIKPGEKLRGLEEMGILPLALPLSELKEAGTADNWSYFWFLVALVLFMAVVALIFYRTLLRGKRRNPVTSGEPVVPGGISPSENERVRNHFDAIANRRFASSVPNAPRPVRIGPIESGFLSGNGVVRYRDGSEQQHQLNRQPAFRARFRLPNGTEETLFFLQGCANDVTFAETRYLGFQWETEQTVMPAPTPVPAQPERVVPLRAVTDGPVATKFTVDGVEIVAPFGTELRVTGASTSLIVPQSGGEVSIRKIGKVKKSPASRKTEVAAK